MVIPAYVDTVAILMLAVRNKLYKIRSKDGADAQKVSTEEWSWFSLGPQSRHILSVQIVVVINGHVSCHGAG